MYIVIVGAGRVGYNLARMLTSGGHEIALIEKDRKRYEALSDRLGESIIYGNGIEEEVLKEAGANRADVLVAATGQDEDNLVVCQLAKVMFFVPRTIARVTDPQNEDIFTGLGIDATVSGTRMINMLIEQKVDASMITPLLALRGNVEIVQVELSGDSPSTGKKISDISLPRECVLISIIRQDKVVFPRGDTVFEENDMVVALVNKKDEQELRKIF
ncbi:MAG: NAD-binding protein [Elusimicrobiota bacterium]